MSLTVGTAGHIDHGKTWLVRALTGKDTDRLPEELAVPLRLGEPPVIGVVRDGRLLLDCRTLSDAEADEAAAAVRACRSR